MNKFDNFCLGICVGMVITLIISSFIVRDIPKAIDVYRNKTTLEITYRDSIPVDSVVVFKKEV